MYLYFVGENVCLTTVQKSDNEQKMIKALARIRKLDKVLAQKEKVGQTSCAALSLAAHLYMDLFVCSSVCLSTFMFVCLFVYHLFVCLFVCPLLCLSVCLSTFCLSVCLSTFMFVCLFVHFYV